MSDLAREIRHAHPLNDPKALCAALGLGESPKDRQNQARGWTVRCPVHGGLSCSVTRANDGTVRVHCFGCDFTGDALSLVAAARGLSTRTDFKAVLREGAELANLYDIVKQLDDGERVERPPFVPPIKAPEPERDYPPIEEVRALLKATQHPSTDAEVSAWLETRKLDPVAVDGSWVAYALPVDAELPSWARYQGKTWTETGHRLLIPVFDHAGELRSVRASRVIDGDSPKRLPPAGHKAAGLVMACPLAQPMLKGTFAPKRVLITEGEPDFLLWCSLRSIEAWARLGITSGSWTPEIAARVPNEALVVIGTDNDPAGDRYATEITETLQARCDVRRKKS